MRRGIITFSGCALNTERIIASRSNLIESIENSRTETIWHETLREMGFETVDRGHDTEILFKYILAAFEIEYEKKLDITYVEGYIASEDDRHTIPHNHTARVFSTKRAIYLDKLMSSVLLEYVATYYLWARYTEDTHMFSFCFRNTLHLLNECCRKGAVDSDAVKSMLMEQIKKHGDANAICLITDLYWCIIAFALCHEVAHIYLGDSIIHCKEQLWRAEYDADAVGYHMFLQLIDGSIHGLASPFSSVFHDYLYVAPMILFLFYHDLFTLGYWLFGDTIGDTHPPLLTRLEKLLEQSQSQDYIFDTCQGNSLLQNYWDISDLFIEELFYKLKNGKLEIIVRKGCDYMAGNGYEEAFQFDTDMCDEMRKIAETHGIIPERMVGLWDIIIQTDIIGIDQAHGFVWSYKDKIYSTKAFNVFFRQKELLKAVIECGLTLTIPENKIKTIQMGLLILFKLCQVVTVPISDDQAKLLCECHMQNAYVRGINENYLLEKLSIPRSTVDELCAVSSIRLENGNIFLNEKILLGIDNP